MTTAASPHTTPSTANTGSEPSPAKWWAGTSKNGPASKRSACMPPATAAATTSGTKARVENSNSSSSSASTTEASGAPNVAAIPAAAPQASRIFRSDGETRIT